MTITNSRKKHMKYPLKRPCQIARKNNVNPWEASLLPRNFRRLNTYLYAERKIRTMQYKSKPVYTVALLLPMMITLILLVGNHRATAIWLISMSYVIHRKESPQFSGETCICVRVKKCACWLSFHWYGRFSRFVGQDLGQLK